MFDIIGKWNTATVYAATVDQESYSQVLRMCNLEQLRDSQIRMMPDMHASEGCTVGTSMTFTNCINPAYVGGDIGCGMQVYKLQNKTIDLAQLDEVIRTYVPSGAAIFSTPNPSVHHVPLDDLHCFGFISHKTVAKSFGTLGGGNHFIEVNRDLAGRLYLVIHSGSRRLGRDVASYHQMQAFFAHNGIDAEEAKKRKLQTKSIKTTAHAEDCFLSGERLAHYLQDMQIAMQYAEFSRKHMGSNIIGHMGFDVVDSFCTVHNYIEVDTKILRKGAVSAKRGEKLLIPINMRDGSLLCTGKGNPAWNFTAPHGAGRVLKRSEAKERITLEAYKAEMQGIFSTCVSESTLDESPLAYRRIDEILDVVDATVQVDDILTPIYNFKASKSVVDEETRDGVD